MELILNGRKMTFNGESVVVSDTGVFVDGRRVNENYEGRNIEVIINGNVGDITCEGAVRVNGNVSGKIKAKGSVSVGGSAGKIDCGGSCTCRDVNGNVECGGSCTCGKVFGDVDAGGSIHYQK